MSDCRVPPDQKWEPWSPDRTAHLLTGCRIRWAVAGGWALDLWRGEQTRPHKDIEIVVTEAAFPVIREHLHDYPFFAAKAGRLTPMPEDTQLASPARQHWVLDPLAAKWRLDVMIEGDDEHFWIYRRDRRIAAPWTQVIATTDRNIPYLRPHIVLLFKAKQPRPVDEFDFDAAVPLLNDQERQWLRDALRLTHAEHQWIERLG